MSFCLGPPASFVSFQFRYPCCSICKSQHLFSCLTQFLCYLPFSNPEKPRISGIQIFHCTFPSSLNRTRHPLHTKHNHNSQPFQPRSKRHARRNLPVSNTPYRWDDPPLASFPALKIRSSTQQEIATCRFWKS